MGKFFFRFGNLLVFSRSHKGVRRGIIPLVSNFLVLTGIILSLEMVLIVLGVGDITLPLTTPAKILLAKLIF